MRVRIFLGIPDEGFIYRGCGWGSDSGVQAVTWPFIRGLLTNVT